MKKFLKYYHPMIFLVLLSFVIGFLLKHFVTEFFNQSNQILSVVAVLTLFVIIAIWAEIIGFIIHACKNKTLNNRIGWAFLIYFFYAFTIPYYNLKYVVKETKVKSKMIGFILLLICSFIVGFVGFNNGKTIYITKNHIQFKFTGAFDEREVGDYDIYVSEYSLDIGAFIHENYDSDSVEYLHQSRETWLKSGCVNVQKIDEYEEVIDDKTIISKIYSGVVEDQVYIYHVSTVELKKQKYLIDFLAIVDEIYYDIYKEDIKEILRNIKYKN